MLTFIFGAGASYDSDQYRRPGQTAEYDDENRPPLASGLFRPAGVLGREVASHHPRATPLRMQLHEAVQAGKDIEEVLEHVAGLDDHPGTRPKLVAIRNYLAELMTRLPEQWLSECDGETNYVRLLDKAWSWNTAANGGTREPISCITFNYDTLLDDAISRVFGADLSTLNDYTKSDEIKLFKPHGSVTWETAFWWDEGRKFLPDRARHRAVERANDLRPVEPPRFLPTGAPRSNVDLSSDLVWLPAVSVPLRRKSAFSMPQQHRAALEEILDRTTTVVAIGWRAREEHFLKLLQDHLPSKPCRLVAVAESRKSAMETVDQLWPLGRFDRYAISGSGFSGFVSPDAASREIEEKAAPPEANRSLDEILADAWSVYIKRQPGR